MHKSCRDVIAVCTPLVGLLAGVVLTSVTYAEDVVELKNGAIARGKVTSQSGDYVVIDVTVNGRKYIRRYPKSSVKSVTLEGGEAASPSAGNFSGMARRTRKEVQDLIDSVGRTPPDWFDSAPLNYPETLDLSWPMPAPQPWNNTKNVGQYVWDRINPNPNQWRSGVKLMHHIMAVNKDNPRVIQQAMRALGHMYHDLLEDYPRAAFWWQQAGVDKNAGGEPIQTVHLADCYHKLGNKDMALEVLRKMSRPPLPAIKLYGDLGETDAALKLAESGAKAGFAVQSFLYAGDVCRVASRVEDAERYYRKALDAAKIDGRNKDHAQRDMQRAQASLAAIQFYRISPQKVRDGTYRASSLGYEDQLEVEVVVAGGRITSVKVTQHREKQFYSSLADTPRNILRRQSLVGIDTTSGATITSEAIINATAKALAQGLQ